MDGAKSGCSPRQIVGVKGEPRVLWQFGGEGTLMREEHDEAVMGERFQNGTLHGCGPDGWAKHQISHRHRLGETLGPA